MKSKFLSELDVRELDDNKACLLSPLVYRSEIYGGTIEVPARFVTDYASVPRAPLAYWICGGRAKFAAVVHDYLYQTHLRDRRTCDKILMEAMGVTKISFSIRWIMYTHVRAYGFFAYNSGPRRFKLFGNKH